MRFARENSNWGYGKIAGELLKLTVVTNHPKDPWVAQQARQYAWHLQENVTTLRHLIHDCDSKYTDAFDTVFTQGGILSYAHPCERQMAMPLPDGCVR